MLLNKLRKRACGFVWNTPIWSTEQGVSLRIPNKPLVFHLRLHLPVELFSLLFASVCTWQTCESCSPVKCYADSRRNRDACFVPARVAQRRPRALWRRWWQWRAAAAAAVAAAYSHTNGDGGISDGWATVELMKKRKKSAFFCSWDVLIWY